MHEILKLVKCKTSHYKYIFASTVLKFLSSRRKLIAGIFNLSVWVYHKINTFLLMEMVVDLIIPKIWCYIYMKVLICLNNQASVVSILLRKLMIIWMMPENMRRIIRKVIIEKRIFK